MIVKSVAADKCCGTFRFCEVLMIRCSPNITICRELNKDIQSDRKNSYRIFLVFFYRARAPPAPLKITLIFFDFRRCQMAHKIYFNFFLCGGCFLTNFCVHYAKGKKHTDFLDGKEVKK